ncbi:MAG: hypothetical protein ACC645_02160, partial [Pirellulales bacterium]
MIDLAARAATQPPSPLAEGEASGARGVGGTSAPAGASATSEQVIYHEDFENGDGGYTADNTGGTMPGLWHYSVGRRSDGQPNHTPIHSWYYGAFESSTGGGHYVFPFDHQGVLISPEIEIPECADTTLSFNNVLGTRLPTNVDFVTVSVDDGVTITQILSRASGSLVQTGNSWLTATADLTPFAGKEIKLRFSFDTGAAPPFDPEGWYIDDVTVTSVPKSVCGYKWEDVNNNRQWDAGEPGLNNWRIYLDLNNDGNWDPTVEPSAVTGNDGKRDGAFLFDQLPTGTYTLREVVPDGWKQTYPGPPDFEHTITISPGQSIIGQFGQTKTPNFGNSEINISGFKWHDADGNGTWDAGEVPLSGWEIQAYRDENGNQRLDQNEFDSGAVDTDTTNSAGRFDLAVGVGDFIVVEVLQNDWQESFPTTSVLAIPLSTGALVLAPGGYAFNLKPDDKILGRPGIAEPPNFGNWTWATIEDSVKFEDRDADGSAREPGEPGLPGWTIYVDYDGDGVLGPDEPSDVTGPDGSYR